MNIWRSIIHTFAMPSVFTQGVWRGINFYSIMMASGSSLVE